MWTSMGAQFIKHKNWDDLATSDWKHLFSMQSNFKKFEEIWRFNILLIRNLFRRWAWRQNLKAVVWELTANLLARNCNCSETLFLLYIWKLRHQFSFCKSYFWAHLSKDIGDPKYNFRQPCKRNKRMASKVLCSSTICSILCWVTHTFGKLCLAYFYSFSITEPIKVAYELLQSYWNSTNSHSKFAAAPCLASQKV